MRANIRKKTILPFHLDEEQLEAHFRHIEAHPETPQSQRVEKILELLSALRDDLTPNMGQVIARLRNALRRYRWASHIAPTPDGYRVIRTTADRENLSKADLWEYEAVRDLLDLVHYLGNPPRIRRCADSACQKWFFAAKRADQLFCSGNCRQHHYDSDEDTRAKKNETMHKLYALKKGLALNPKSGIGLERRPARRGTKPKATPRTRKML
jgi:hypothetical protein